MQTFNLTILSKNKKSLEKFLIFFKKQSELNFTFANKKFKKKQRKKIITILKSPHVNKTAQEQFEIRNWCVQLTIYVTQPFKFLISIKNTKTTLFPDLDIKIKVFYNGIQQKLISKKKLDLNNYNFNSNFKILKKNSYVRNFFNDVKNNKNLLKILELYGK